MWQPWRIWAFQFWLLLLLVVPASAGRHSQKLVHGESTDAAVELDRDTFNQTLVSQPTPYAIVEFFANWCPACQKYKPHYERVARLFNGHSAPYPGHLYMAKVDCALPVNRGLCDQFEVGHFPTLYWGRPYELTLGKRSSRDTVEIEGARNADKLLQWINNRSGRNYEFGAPPVESGELGGTSYVQVPVQVHDTEEVTVEAVKIILDSNMLKPESKSAFVNFLQLLVLHHPSKRCRIGSAEVLSTLDDLWPSSKSVIVNEAIRDQPGANFNALKDVDVCGKSRPRGWRTCRGSKRDTRGYRCMPYPWKTETLWMVATEMIYQELSFVSCCEALQAEIGFFLPVCTPIFSVRVDDWESASTLKAIQDFVLHFFPCQECRAHFAELKTSLNGTASSRHELVLWLWRAHNEVNGRLMKEEGSGGDPKYPKVIWPPKSVCPACMQETEDSAEQGPKWDETEVLSFILTTYGSLLIPSYTEASSKSVNRDLSVAADVEEGTNSSVVSVPMGAAVGIGLASCGFGVGAFCWRIHQKRKKRVYRRV